MRMDLPWLQILMLEICEDLKKKCITLANCVKPIRDMSLSESRPVPVPVYVRHGHAGQGFQAQDGGHVDQEHERLYSDQYQGQGYPEKEHHGESENRGFQTYDLPQHQLVGGGDPADGGYYGYGFGNHQHNGDVDYGNDQYPKNVENNNGDSNRAHEYGLQGSQALPDNPVERDYHGGDGYYGGAGESLHKSAGNQYETDGYSNEYFTNYDEYDYQIEEDFEKELNRNGAGFHDENPVGHLFRKESSDHAEKAEYNMRANAGVYLQGFGEDIFADNEGGSRTAEFGFDEFHTDQYDFLY